MAGRAPDVHLTDGGREQAKGLASWLPPVEAIFSSPMERCRETAEPLASARGLPVSVEEGLTELDFGDWTMMTLEDIQRQPNWGAFNTFRSGHRPPNGESMLEAQTRVVNTILRLAEGREGTIALFSHGDPIKSALMHFLGIPIDLFLRFEISTASASAIEISPWHARVLYMNRIP